MVSFPPSRVPTSSVSRADSQAQSPPSWSSLSDHRQHCSPQVRSPDNAAPSPPNGATALFNDLIRPQQQRRRDGEAERFGGLEVDDELELRWLLDGKTSRLRALQDLVH